MPARKIDRTLFAAAALLVLAVSVPLFLFTEASEPYVSSSYNWIASNLGVLYQVFAIATMVFLGWLVVGPYGSIRLGGDKPDFSTFSWAGMLFCAGTGASLLVWSGVEWAFYYDNPPFGAEARSTAALEWASAYGPFHWGITAWCFYALPTIAVAYSFYVRQVPYLRASTSLHEILGEGGENRPLGRLVDLCVMIALIGGAGTSLGVIAPTIAASVAILVGIETSFSLQLAVMFFCIGLFGFSVYMGLRRGIKRLSDLNVYLALGFLAFIVLAGPSLFILKNTVNTVGFMLDNFVRMMTWTDPVNQTGFVESWTIFYWAWWIAFAPPVGIFVARISRGRTIRQVVLSMIALGTLGCWIFYFVMGNYSLFLELDGSYPVVETLAKTNMYVTLSNVVETLPLGNFALLLFVVVMIISVATTYDSASYTLASTVTRELREGENPARWNRLFWAAVLGMLPIVMMAMGGLEIIRSAVLVSSLPLLIIGVGMAVSLARSLMRDHNRNTMEGTGHE